MGHKGDDDNYDDGHGEVRALAGGSTYKGKPRFWN